MKRAAPSARLFFTDDAAADGGPVDAPTTPAEKPMRRVADAEPLVVLLLADEVGWVSPLCPRPMDWVPLAGPYAALVQHGLQLPSPGVPPPA